MIFLLLSLKIYFFFSPDCPDCKFVKENLIKKIEDRYDIEYFDINIPENMKTLMSIEDRKKDYDNKIPVVYVGDSIFGSKEEIMEGLLNYLETLNDTSSVELKNLENIRLENPVKILYFYSTGCKKCERMEYELKLLKEEMNGLIIESYELTKSANFLYNIEKNIGVEKGKILVVPVVILNDKIYFKDDIHNLKDEIIKVSVSGNLDYYERYKEESSLNELFSILRFGSIFTSGLIDGINPCAFATLIFLISLFSLSGRRQDVFLSGIGFIISVYFTYLLIGFGIFSFIRSLSIFLTISRVIYIISGSISVIFAVLSIIDIVRIKKNKEIILKMPSFLKKLSRKLSRNIYSNSIVFLSSIVIGFLVSLFEFTCTGQIYLPFITYLAQNPYFKISALKPLLIYNIGFILPIIVIFLIYLTGVREFELSKTLNKRIILIKLLTAILLFTLAAFIFLSV